MVKRACSTGSIRAKTSRPTLRPATIALVTKRSPTRCGDNWPKTRPPRISVSSLRCAMGSPTCAAASLTWTMRTTPNRSPLVCLAFVTWLRSSKSRTSSSAVSYVVGCVLVERYSGAGQDEPDAGHAQQRTEQQQRAASGARAVLGQSDNAQTEADGNQQTADRARAVPDPERKAATCDGPP